MGLLTECAKAENARSFLKYALAHQYNGRAVNLADFSRRVGFSSRSFLSEYLRSKKSLSGDSLRAIRAALKLPAKYLTIFELLVFVEQPELLPPRLRRVDIKSRLKEARERCNAVQNPGIKDVGRLVSIPQVFLVFASLGNLSVGTEVEAICKKTRLKTEAVISVLQILIEEGAVQKRGKRFFAASSKFDFLELDQKANLASMLSQAVAGFTHNPHQMLDDPNALVFYSAFSVATSRLPMLKERLREVVIEVMDEFQDDNGSDVREVLICSK